MSAEVKSGATTLEAGASRSLKKAFKSHCKKLNVSMAQRIRDLVQGDMKKKR